MNKNPSTDERSPASGLTPQQEKAAALLASGQGIQAVADELGIDPATLLRWRKLPTFQAYSNKLVLELKDRIRAEQLSMGDEAIDTVRRIMTGENAGAALRAAQFVIAQIASAEVGDTDPEALLRKQQEENFMDALGHAMFDKADGSEPM